MPNWSAVLLEEPEEHVVDVPPTLQTAIENRMRPDFVPVLRFLIMVGQRTGSVLVSPDGHGPLRPEQVDFDARVITFVGKSKKPGGKRHRVPMSREVMLLVANEIGKHPDAVFTYVAQTTRNGMVRGQRYPIAQTSFYTEFKRAAAAAGFPGLRPHDLRHTSGNRTLHATGNLRLVQKLLGHTRVSTTERYTHPDLDALRAALDVVHGPGISPEEIAPEAT